MSPDKHGEFKFLELKTSWQWNNSWKLPEHLNSMYLALKQSDLNKWKINTEDPYVSLYLPFFSMRRLFNENVFIPPD